MKTKALVVDDSAFSRQMIKKMLDKGKNIEVVDTATDGMDAMVKTIKYKPDIITLDFEMPNMDGFSFLRWIMQHQPTPVIMVSSYSDRNTVFMALELGAVDFVVKPTKMASVELMSIEKDLIKKVEGIRQLNMEVLSRNLQRTELKELQRIEPEVMEQKIDLVAIGTSTGGPPALQYLLQSLPSDFSAAIVISQHMPAGFTRSMAGRLNKRSSMKVKEAEQGDVVKGGHVYLCPGGMHMVLDAHGESVSISLREATSNDKYVPSVDKMLKSAAKSYGDRMIGVVLTGMGNDGKKGMIDVKAKGSYTIAESAETSVVFGMPNEVIKAGAAANVLPLYDIPYELIRKVMGERRV